LSIPPGHFSREEDRHLGSI